MQKSRKILGGLFVLIMLVLSAQASEGYKNLFVTITTDNLKQAGMGVAVAGAFQGAGVKTTVLIGAEASHLVLKKGNQEKFGPTGKSIRDMLISLSKNGGTVMLCGMCASFEEITTEDVIEGAKIVTPSDVAGALLAPSTQSLSF
ncbi:MAG: DsrE family protein [Arcobacteraceae bacterium]|nr:DsrE family protein [Arcobacteraceae bacterium]